MVARRWGEVARRGRGGGQDGRVGSEPRPRPGASRAWPSGRGRAQTQAGSPWHRPVVSLALLSLPCHWGDAYRTKVGTGPSPAPSLVCSEVTQRAELGSGLPSTGSISLYFIT